MSVISKMEIDFSEIEQAYDEFIGGAFDQWVKLALDGSAEDVANEAKTNHNYTDRTGNLTNSIMSGEAQRTGETIGVDIVAGNLDRVAYARAIEEGTSVITARLFLANAINKIEPNAEEDMDRAMERAFREVGL